MNEDYMMNFRKDNAKVKRVELHAHTKMSERDAVVSARELIMTAANWGWDAVAITDHGVVQAFPEAINTVISEKLDIKIIYGMEGYLTEAGYQPGRTQYAHSPTRHVTLLAKNQEGLQNLYRLVSVSHLRYFSRKPRIPKNILQEYREGLLIGSACESGELIRAIAANEKEEKLVEIAEFYDFLEIMPIKNYIFLLKSDSFPNINIEEDLKNINRKVAELSVKLKKPLVATSDIHSLNPSDSLCRNIVRAQWEYMDWDTEYCTYLMTSDEMLKEFDYLGESLAYEAVITNTRKIADMIERLTPIPDCLYTKTIPNSDYEIKKIIDKNAHRLYGEQLPKIVKKRLDKELAYILKNGFSAFYLASYQTAKMAEKKSYLIGYRGLIGASFVAFLMRITETNPLPPHWRCPKCQHSEFSSDAELSIGLDLPDKKCSKCGETLTKEGYNIPFEFFSGIDGKNIPDIDLDFSASHRSDICKYMIELYGEGKVLGANYIRKFNERVFYLWLLNIGTSKLDKIYPLIKKYLKIIGQELNEKSIRYIAQRCKGMKLRDLSYDNIVIIPQDVPVDCITPIQNTVVDGDSRTITHFDYYDLYTRLVNIGICTNDGLTLLEALQKVTNISANNITFNISNVFGLFNSVDPLKISAKALGENTGLFGIPEFEGFYIREIIREIKPNCFDNLVKILGFYKGSDAWLGNAQDLIRNGICSVGDTIGTREDIVTYLQKNGVDSSLSLTIANNVSEGKGIGKEIEEKLKAAKIPSWYIESCQKIKRLVSRSEVVANALLAYRIAYYKLYYPVDFYTAYFSMQSKMNDVNIIFKGIDEVRKEIQRLSIIEMKEFWEKEKMCILQVALEMYLRGYELSPSDVYCDRRDDADLKNFVNKINNLSFE